MSDYENGGCGQYFFVIIVVPFILLSILVLTFGDDIIVPWLILTFIWYLFCHILTDSVKKKRDKEWKRKEIKMVKQDIKNYTKLLNALKSEKDKINDEIDRANNLYFIKEYKKMIKRAEDRLEILKRK